MSSSVKVMLTGDGGDDVFLGYPAHRHLWLAQNLSRVLPSAVKNSWLALRSIFPRVGPLRRAAALFDYTVGGLDARVSYSNSLPVYKMQGLLGDRLSSLPDFNETTWSVNGGYQILEEYLEYERKHWFVSEFMTKVDGATMHYGLEARSPFFDHCIWEFASSLPFGLRLHGSRLKSILRELASRRISWAVANRRKKGVWCSSSALDCRSLASLSRISAARLGSRKGRLDSFAVGSSSAGFSGKTRVGA